VKTPEERGPIGQWAWEQRHAHGWSDHDVVLKLATEHYIAMRDSSYRGIEAGQYRPGAEVLAALEAIYGTSAPEVAPRTAPAGDEALRASVASLEATVATLEARLAGVEAALADHLAARHAGRTPDGSKR
jgi:hypothetical protein